MIVTSDYLFTLDLLVGDSNWLVLSIAFTSLCNSLTTVASAYGFTPFSHNLMHIFNVVGSKFVFNSLEIWYSVWNVLRAAFI